VWHISLQLRAETVRKAREHAPAASEDNVPQQDLAQVRVARAGGRRNECRNSLWKVGVRGLTDTKRQIHYTYEIKHIHTTSCGECVKYISPTENRSAPK
jgi:hypothetical protein